jgi:signal transduction histidine kinase
MTERRSRRLAWSGWSLGVLALASAQVVFLIEGRGAQEPSQAIAFIAIGTVGLILATHARTNPLGWIFLAVWVGIALYGLAGAYGLWTTVHDPGAPGSTFCVWLTNWAWVPLFGMVLSFPFLLFPDGHLPSPRWRKVAWATAIVIALWAFSFALQGSQYTDALSRPAPNPYSITHLIGFFNVATGLLAFVFISLMATCWASLVVRFRRGSAELRAQIKWLIPSGALLVVFTALPVNHGSGGIVDVLMGVLLTLIPVSIGIAILKYRLYDIDFVIRKTVVYAALALFITVVYVAIVVGVGALVGQHSSAALSAVAAAVVALAFQPARRRAQRLADRLVFGKRATPYEVLSEFSDSLADTVATNDLLPRMAKILAEGTGAARADVWLMAGHELRPAATFPPGSPELAPVEAADPSPGVVLVRHQGELLGALSIAKEDAEPMTPAEEKLVADLASQAGLVMRNAALIEDLKASRQRLVSAQDQERRRIERNIHDGAQQQLVALAVKLRLADGLVGKNEARAHEVLADIQAETTQALDDLRDLARGIYPPLLADKGLVAALESQLRRSTVPVTLLAGEVGRFARDAEAAVYFCCLEALQNVSKYAEASSAKVELSDGTGSVTFVVTDDGVGFDDSRTSYGTGLQGMADRLDALGGSLRVISRPGEGTTVMGSLPVASVGPETAR